MGGRMAMKNTKIICCLAAFLMVALACNKNEEAPEREITQAEEVVFNAEIEHLAQPRTTTGTDAYGILSTNWNADDRIGLFAKASGENIASNLQYKVLESGPSSAFAPVSEPVSWKDGSATHSFYAYCPYTETASLESVPFTIPAVQTQSGASDASHIASADLLFASAADLTMSQTVRLAFKHSIAVLEIDLSTSFSDLSLSSINATFADGKMAGDCIMNLSDGSISGFSESSVTLNLSSPVTLDETVKKFYLAIAPGHAGQELTLELVIGGNSVIYKKTPSMGILAGQKAVLPISVTPPRRASGIREAGKTLLWSKNLSDISGISNPANVNGLAFSKGNLLLSEVGNTAPVYLDALTGVKKGTMDVSAMTSAQSNTNYYATSDDTGNILFCTLWKQPSSDVVETIYKAASVSETPVSFNATKKVPKLSIAGWKFSVSGSIDSNAIISMPMFVNGYGTLYLICWQVSGGKLINGNWFTNLGTMTRSNYPTYSDAIYAGYGKYADIFFTTFEKNSADSNRYLYRYTCTDNSTSSGTFSVAEKIANPVNVHENAVDFITFNNASYVATTISHPFSYNVTGANTVRMFDVTGGDFTKPVTLCESNVFALGSASTQNVNSYADVLFHKSDDGNYLYVYLLFAANQVACFRYDCFAD